MARQNQGRELVVGWLNDTKGLPEAKRMTRLITRIDEKLAEVHADAYATGFTDGKNFQRKEV